MNVQPVASADGEFSTEAAPEVAIAAAAATAAATSGEAADEELAVALGLAA